MAAQMSPPRYLILFAVLSCGFTHAANRLPLSAQLIRMQSQVDILRRDVDQLLGELHRTKGREPVDLNLEGDGNVYAHCRMVPNGIYDPDTYEPIIGDIDMRQRAVGGALDVKLFLYGFMTPKSVHAIHVHTYGDLRHGCRSAGSHYNPGGNNHSAPYDKDRHMGDWGNIQVDDYGRVESTFTDKIATLVGHDSILGRTIVIHIGADDLGKRGSASSRKTGNAGGRLGCCVIGRSDGSAWLGYSK